MGKKKVLILYGQPGKGHLMVAQAVKETFLKNYPEIEIKDADVFDFCSKIFRYGYPYLYDRIVFKFPIIFKAAYKNYKNRLFGRFVNNAALFFTKKSRLISFISGFSPDFILSTNPLPLQLISLIKQKNIIDIPSANVCTDFGFHLMWYNPDIDYYFVANDEIKKSLMDYRVDPDKIQTTGIPVRLKFNQTLDRQKILAKLSLNPFHPVLLIIGGQLTYSELLRVIAGIKEKNNHAQFIIVAGRDENLQKRLKTSELKNDPAVKIFDFVDNLEEFMAAADLILSKAGGSTVAECLVRGLPMIVNKTTPGQEEDNVDYLISHGAGIKVKNTEEIIGTVADLFNRSDQLANMKENCRKIAKPNAAEDLVGFIISQI